MIPLLAHPSYRLKMGTWLALSWCISFFLLGCPNQVSNKRGTSRNTRFAQGPLYKIKLKNVNDQEVSFRQFYGKVLLVDFFATSCPRCEIVVIPLLKKLYQRYEERGFRVVGIALQPQAKLFLRPFARVLHIPYPVVIGDASFAGGRTLFGRVNSIPRSYLLDQCGRIKHFFYGQPNPKLLEQKIKQLLQQRPSCSK